MLVRLLSGAREKGSEIALFDGRTIYAQPYNGLTVSFTFFPPLCPTILFVVAFAHLTGGL